MDSSISSSNDSTESSISNGLEKMNYHDLSSLSGSDTSIIDLDREKGPASPDRNSFSQKAEEVELPEKQNWARRAFYLPYFSTHRRLILLIAVTNFGLLALVLALGWWHNLPALGYLIIGNLTFATLIRQQNVINCLYKLATCAGTRLPLSVRWMLGKVYHFGGLHSGCSVSAAVWLLLFTISATYLRATGHAERPSGALLVLTYLLLLLLSTMVLLALPKFRSRFHNSFEVSHRFLGWTAVCLEWAHVVVLINDYKRADQSLTMAFFRSVSPYLLLLISLSILSPWLALRKAQVTVTRPSDHAIIVSFGENLKAPLPGSYLTISVEPLFEWHSFACIPWPSRDGFRLIISRAGDWTSAIIDDPPSSFWIKGTSTAGVATVIRLFRKVLFVCTGSGIAPILPHLLSKEVPSMLFWSTRTPRETYGDDLVDEVLHSSPEVMIHDTAVYGRPDMVAISFRMAKVFGAEAVLVISNQKLTRKVVYGLESRGMPAFGAIWDS